MLIAVLIAGCAARVAAEAPVSSELLERAESAGSVRVIVELAGEDIQATQDQVLQALTGTQYRVLHRYHAGPFLALEVSAEALRRLAQSPIVRRIEEDRVLTPQDKTP